MGLITKRKERTYRAATANGVVAAAGADMFFVITGSATKEVHVHKLRISGLHLTTLAVVGVVVEKRSTAPSGGTASALITVPLDSASPTATADLVQVYTVAPTEGTLIGTIAANRPMLKSATVVDGASFTDLEFVFGDHDETQPVILRGVTQNLSLAFAAAPASAVTLDVEVEWTEE